MTGTNCDLFTHNQSRSYLNHLVLVLKHYQRNLKEQGMGLRENYFQNTKYDWEQSKKAEFQKGSVRQTTMCVQNPL
jgi:hypothetical protein